MVGLKELRDKFGDCGGRSRLPAESVMRLIVAGGRSYGSVALTDRVTAEDEDYDRDARFCGPCLRCGGDGTIIICPDDMCRGAGECMHGDGEIPCPECDNWMDQ
jgi:hypothetical protein